ncbi:hypothetical protein KC730_01185 [Candidatus Kaiserbacteria bacterium]|nr:hypothetical protein [Candidatus Kaiserbacteria bacterium]
MFDLCKRVFVGDFWIKAQKPSGVGNLVPADIYYVMPRGAKGWRDDGGWKWVLLRANIKPYSESQKYKYKVFFIISDFCMVHFTYVRTEYVALRVGADDVKFIAFDKAGKEVPLKKICHPTPRQIISHELPSRGIRPESVTWI